MNEEAFGKLQEKQANSSVEVEALALGMRINLNMNKSVHKIYIPLHDFSFGFRENKFIALFCRKYCVVSGRIDLPTAFVGLCRTRSLRYHVFHLNRFSADEWSLFSSGNAISPECLVLFSASSCASDLT